MFQCRYPFLFIFLFNFLKTITNFSFGFFKRLFVAKSSGEEDDDDAADDLEDGFSELLQGMLPRK